MKDSTEIIDFKIKRTNTVGGFRTLLTIFNEVDSKQDLPSDFGTLRQIRIEENQGDSAKLVN